MLTNQSTPVNTFTHFQQVWHIHCNYIHLTAFVQDNLGKLAPERSTILDFNEARDDGPYAIICTSLQTNNHTRTSPLSFYRPDALPVTQPCKQRQSTEGVIHSL